MAPADLLSSGGPNADAAASGVDDFGIRIEVRLGTEGRTIVSELGGLNQLGEKPRVQGGVVIQQEDELGAVIESVADAEIGARGEANISLALDYVNGVLKLMPERPRLTSLRAVIYDDSASIRVCHPPKTVEALAGILQAVPVEDNDVYERFCVQQMETFELEGMPAVKAIVWLDATDASTFKRGVSVTSRAIARQLRQQPQAEPVRHRACD